MNKKITTTKIAIFQEKEIRKTVYNNEWSELTTQEHKNIKSLKNQNLRDHMTEKDLSKIKTKTCQKNPTITSISPKQ